MVTRQVRVESRTAAPAGFADSKSRGPAKRAPAMLLLAYAYNLDVVGHAPPVRGAEIKDGKCIRYPRVGPASLRLPSEP